MMRRACSRLFPELSLVLLLVASGCDTASYDTDTDEANTVGAAKQPAEGLSVADPASRTSNANASQAAGLPEGVAAYPDSVFVESLRIASKGSEVNAPEGVAMFLSIETNSKRVIDWFDNELTREGWTLAERNEEGEGENRLYSKAERELSVSVGPLPAPKPDGHADKQLIIVVDAS